jgi:hypothetical protein
MITRGKSKQTIAADYSKIIARCNNIHAAFAGYAQIMQGDKSGS